MKCLCGFVGRKESWMTISNFGSSFIGTRVTTDTERKEQTTKHGTFFPRFNIGNVEVFVCPDCGTLRSDMNGNIKKD